MLWAGGTDFLVICTNTMPIVAPQIEFAIQIPLCLPDTPGTHARKTVSKALEQDSGIDGQSSGC